MNLEDALWEYFMEWLDTIGTESNPIDLTSDDEEEVIDLTGDDEDEDS